MIPEYKLKAKDIRHKMLETMLEHLTLEANGYQCTTEMVMDVVMKASAEQSSIEAACADLEEVADSNTIRPTTIRITLIVIDRPSENI